MGAPTEVQDIDGKSNVLQSKLDDLLERYLHTLDEYTKARADLAQNLSAVRLTP